MSPSKTICIAPGLISVFTYSFACLLQRVLLFVSKTVLKGRCIKILQQFLI